MSALNSASAAQISAADPSSNVWLVANAGSGKTKVLTDRVARLLLRGTDPQNILCLTYTKAAAAEMQNRLFRRLGEWAMARNDELFGNLRELGEEASLSEAGLRRARQLFARAIETPGGIRIQTIHSFCAGLLRRFPLEAGVSPSFTELDDRSAGLLRDEILEQMAEDEARPLFEAILGDAGERMDDLLLEITGRRADLAVMPDEGALRAAFGLPEGLDYRALLDMAFGPGDLELLGRVGQQLKAAKGKTDPAAGEVLAAITSLNLATLSQLEGLFLYKTGERAGEAKCDKFPTKDSRAALGADLDLLQGLMNRIADVRPLRLGLSALGKALDLHAFAAEFLRRYEAAKARRGWLDFDDFITRATALLTDPAVAPWVLYRLDGSIDHVLVDEAQDTSPAQWRIIAALTEEFMAGEGAREAARSLFVVGDKKQSIYSFQGADVAGFDQVKTRFAEGFEGAGVPVAERSLIHSFRSSQAILALVDLCFQGPMQQALGGDFRHQPFHEALPGRVDLWPVVPKPEKPEPREWFDPVDLTGETDAPVVLAGKVAAEIAQMIREGRQIPDHKAPGGFRPLAAGDFLILVQRRGEIFKAIIRACKAEGLPIAGPDRLLLTGELGVRDLLALLSFLNTPEDDLSLAIALRSPLFGWSEAQLFRLARGRKYYLWEALRHSQESETLAVLDDLRRQSEFLRPYELLDRILTRHRGRALLLGRMGEEAADAIDELSQQALAYERAEVPSLTGFLVWMQAGDLEVKRQAEGEGGLIRVMTVHGSKGLEAPVVILPDTGDRKLQDRDQILALDKGLMTWSGRKADDPDALAATKAARAEAREAENLRLLYVAITRAKHWLIVAAAGEAGDSSWYGIIAKGLAQLAPAEGAGGRLHYEFGDWAADLPGPALAPDLPGPSPANAFLPLAPAKIAPRLWSPSGLGGGEAIVVAGERLPMPDFEEDDPLERGTKLHLLLQHLADRPPAAWEDLARSLGAGAALLAEARAILQDPDLAWLFSGNSLAEVEVTAPWNGGNLAGSIDRLVIGEKRVVIVDFKSNSTLPRRPEEVPEPYLRQLGAYAHAVAAIYPGRAVETAILWTRAPRLMAVPVGLCEAALQRAQSE